MYTWHLLFSRLQGSLRRGEGKAWRAGKSNGKTTDNCIAESHPIFQIYQPAFAQPSWYLVLNGGCYPFSISVLFSVARSMLATPMVELCRHQCWTDEHLKYAAAVYRLKMEDDCNGSLTVAQTMLEHHLKLGDCKHRNLLVCKSCAAINISGLQNAARDETTGYEILCFDTLTMLITVWYLILRLLTPAIQSFSV